MLAIGENLYQENMYRADGSQYTRCTFLQRTEVRCYKIDRGYASVSLLRAVGSFYFVTADFQSADATYTSTWSAVGTKHVTPCNQSNSGEEMVSPLVYIRKTCNEPTALSVPPVLFATD